MKTARRARRSLPAWAWGTALSLLTVQPAGALEFKAALEAAYLNNPALAAARAGFQSQAELVPQARSGFFPEVELTGAQAYKRTVQHASEVASGTTAPRNLDESQSPSSLGVSLTMNLYAGGQTLAATRGAEAQAAAARADLHAVEQRVLLTAAEAYARVGLAQAQLELYTQSQTELEGIEQWVREMFRHQQITVTYVAAVEARLAAARADTAAAQARLETARARFLAVTGMEADTTTRWPTLPPAPPTLEEAISTAVAASPTLARSQYLLQAVEEAVRQRKGAMLPQVNLQANVALDWNAARFTGADDYKAFDREDNWSVGVNLEWPLFAGGRNVSRVRQAKYSAAQARSQLQQARLDLRTSVVSRWQALQAARARVQAVESQAASAQVAYRGYRRQFRSGMSTMQDVLNAQLEWTRARIDLEQARHDVFASSAELLATIGWFDAERLGLGIQTFDPEGHMARTRTRLWGLQTSD